MSPLPRGFKTWTERISAGIRRELGVPRTGALPPGRLAEHLNVRLWTPRDVPGLPPEILSQLLDRDPTGWSAVTQEIDGDIVVIYNPRHSSGRQASDITHELAHLLLEHAPGKVILSADGALVMRSYDPKQEDEANWLAWTLLLPRLALLHAARSGMDVAQIAETYGVSETLVRFRMRICGVDAQVRAARAHARKRVARPRP